MNIVIAKDGAQIHTTKIGVPGSRLSLATVGPCRLRRGRDRCSSLLNMAIA